MSNATPWPQPPAMQPIAIWNPTRGIWEVPELDLFGQQEQFWETWPTSGWMRHGSVYPLPQSAHPTHDFESSSSPTALFRTPLASDASRGGETLQHVKVRRGTIALSHQIIDLALPGPGGYPRQEQPDSLLGLIGQFFNAGDATPALSQGGSESPTGQPLHQRF